MYWPILTNVSAERKRQKKATGNDDINKLVWEWFKNATSRRINLSGPLIKEKALKFAQDLGVESFKASNEWLESFKHRHNIVMGTMSGERGDVSNDTVNDWKSKLPTVRGVHTTGHLQHGRDRPLPQRYNKEYIQG